MPVGLKCRVSSNTTDVAFWVRLPWDRSNCCKDIILRSGDTNLLNVSREMVMCESQHDMERSTTLTAEA